jgi:hypothetical protein
MRPLTVHELSELRVRHSRASNPSQRIRKGWEVRDETEPNGWRLLTDAEIEEITRPAEPAFDLVDPRSRSLKDFKRDYLK